MKWRFPRLHSFRSRILLSFFAFCCVLFIWVFFYFSMSLRYQEAQRLTAKLSQLQNRYFESTGNLQYFMLAGFHEPEFYTSYRQKDIDHFLNEEASIINSLKQLGAEAASQRIHTDKETDTLLQLHTRLMEAASRLKLLYYKKGFKDYGTEGMMRRYAHFLEDSSRLPKMSVLMLRRHEKDFLMRGEVQNIKSFNALVETEIKRFPAGSAAGDALAQYKKYFNELVGYALQLGIYNYGGVYGEVQGLLNQLDALYAATAKKVARETSDLNRHSRILLIIISGVLLATAIILSIVLSNILTRATKELNNRMQAFIQSRFKEQTIDDKTNTFSGIIEVEQLNNSFVLLQTTLNNTLAELEEHSEEEKIASNLLADTIKMLNEKVVEIERRKQEIANSEAKLNAFFNSSQSCHVLVGKDMNIITYNKAALGFIRKMYGEPDYSNTNILEYLHESYRKQFSQDFSAALAGRYIQEERLIDYGEQGTIWWDFSFVPVTNAEDEIIGVAFNATDINERKAHEEKIQSQNEALLKIAHVQSHEIRGPVVTILGLIHIISEENNFTQEYLRMLQEAVDALDKKIYEIVHYTQDRDNTQPPGV